jgi:hypothetical protein
VLAAVIILEVIGPVMFMSFHERRRAVRVASIADAGRPRRLNR